jgi:hypothetical protein
MDNETFGSRILAMRLLLCATSFGKGSSSGMSIAESGSEKMPEPLCELLCEPLCELLMERDMTHTKAGLGRVKSQFSDGRFPILERNVRLFEMWGTGRLLSMEHACIYISNFCLEGRFEYPP